MKILILICLIAIANTSYAQEKCSALFSEVTWSEDDLNKVIGDLYHLKLGLLRNEVPQGYVKILFRRTKDDLALRLGMSEVDRRLKAYGATQKIEENAASVPPTNPELISRIIKDNQDQVLLNAFLLQHGFRDIHGVGREGFDVIHWAIIKSRFDILSILIDMGHPFSQEDKNFGLYTSAQRGSLALVKKFVEFGADIDARLTSRNNTPIAEACSRNNKHVVDYLISIGADVNVPNSGLETPLMVAAQKGYSKIVESLLAAPKIDINAVNFGKNTALHVAYIYDHLEIAKLLIKANADLNITSEKQDPVLLHSIQDEKSEFFDLLVSSNADINVRDRVGRTPLIVATIKNDKKTVKKLLSMHANLDLRVDNINTTALGFARSYGHKEIEKLLIESGAEE